MWNVFKFHIRNLDKRLGKNLQPSKSKLSRNNFTKYLATHSAVSMFIHVSINSYIHIFLILESVNSSMVQ